MPCWAKVPANITPLPALISRAIYRCQDCVRPLDCVIARHQQLAARFDIEVTGQPLQLLPLELPDARNRWPLEVRSFVSLDASEHEAELAKIQQLELARHFDIATADVSVLLNAVLVERGEQQYSLFLTAHHLVVDGWSTPI